MVTENVSQKLPTGLKHWKYEIERLGRKWGLNFRPNIIVMSGHEDISEFAAYSGYPMRYHHWRFGQESKRLKTSYRWGLHIIYEMVVPTNPCYSYFLDANPQVIQKAVIAHACVGHNDFFENNAWFQDVPTNLHHRFGDNATKVEEIRLEIGREKVDKFLESCLSLDNLFDLTKPIIIYEPQKIQAKKAHRLPRKFVTREKLPHYMEEYINPPEFLQEEQKRIDAEEQKKVDVERGAILPAEPLADVLDFILKHAPLEDWQQEIVRIAREESICLMKGAQTKIMNEGWAAFWEAWIMAGEGAAVDSEICAFARTFAGVQGGRRSGINPYKLGKEIWDDIKFRWDTGRHGPIYEDCQDAVVKGRWEEFIVFKTLLDQYKTLGDELQEAWGEFTTLVHETRHDRGFIRRAFFLPENWIEEWLKYKEAEQKLPELKKALQETRELESKFPPYDLEEAQTCKFTTSYCVMLHQIKQNSQSPYRFWTSEELEREIRHYEFYQDLKRRIKNNEMRVHTVEIPLQWIKWAQKYEFWGRLGQGFEKMFEVRATYNDVNFIHDFFTQELCEKHEYYTIGIGKVPQDSWYGDDHYIVRSRNYLRVKRFIINEWLNLGQPKILLFDANFKNNSELRLIHLHDGRDLCYDGCPNCGRVAPGIKEVLERLYAIWNKGKAVHVETIKTLYPTRKPPWYYWRPPWYPPIEPDETKYQWVRYTYNGQYHSSVILEFSKVENVEKIKGLVPFMPDTFSMPITSSSYDDA